jgi:hypothetical protein
MDKDMYICIYVYMYMEVFFSYKEWSPAICRKWVELEIIMFSKITQIQEDKYCMFFSYMETWKKDGLKVEKGQLEKEKGVKEGRERK